MNVRIRKEYFGFILAFSDGEIGFYSDGVADLLLRGATRSDLEPLRLHSLPVCEGFHLKSPLIVWFEITRSCNLSCNHCYIEAGKPREYELSTQEIFIVLDQLRAMDVFSLVLTGGEPMLHPDFLAIVQYAKKLGFIISITTNGTCITPEIIDQLPLEECIVSVSVEGFRSHEEMRSGSTFDEIKESLCALKRKGIPIALMATQTGQNTAELEAVFEYALEHGYFFGTTPFTPVGRGRLYPQYLPGIDVADASAHLYMKEKKHEEAMMDTVGLCVLKFLDECYRIARSTRRSICGVSMAYILSDGSVYPCALCASVGKHQAGNVRSDAFRKIWDKSFQFVRRITFDDHVTCADCELSGDPYYCTSRCPVTAELYTGNALGCGATPYGRKSLKRRTELLLEKGYSL
jgi:radical SAM protein with 4Fe4S-binding SPASM domain